MTDQPDDPYATPPAYGAPPVYPPPPTYGAPPPVPPAYGAPPPQYGAPPPVPPPVPPAYGAPQYGAPPPQYGAPQYGAPYGQHAPGYTPAGYPPPSTTSGYAIASLACSIVLAVIFGLGSVLGVVFGIIGLKHCKTNNERGRGLAIAGIVIGALGIAFWSLGLIFALADPSSTSSGTSTNIGALAALHSALP